MHAPASGAWDACMHARGHAPAGTHMPDARAVTYGNAKHCCNFLSSVTRPPPPRGPHPRGCDHAPYAPPLPSARPPPPPARCWTARPRPSRATAPPTRTAATAPPSCTRASFSHTRAEAWHRTPFTRTSLPEQVGVLCRLACARCYVRGQDGPGQPHGNGHGGKVAHPAVLLSCALRGADRHCSRQLLPCPPAPAPTLPSPSPPPLQVRRQADKLPAGRQHGGQPDLRGSGAGNERDGADAGAVARGEAGGTARQGMAVRGWGRGCRAGERGTGSGIRCEGLCCVVRAGGGGEGQGALPAACLQVVVQALRPLAALVCVHTASSPSCWHGLGCWRCPFMSAL